MTSSMPRWGVLVHAGGMRKLGEVYAEFTGEPIDYPPIAHDKKLAVDPGSAG